MISIVMAYFNRRQQILNTLQNFQEFYASRYDFEVIIIDDDSFPEHQLINDLFSFTFPIKYHIISKQEKGKTKHPRKNQKCHTRQNMSP